MKKFFINLISVPCILMGVFLATSWLAPVPLSEWGGLDRYRDASTQLLFWGSLFIFFGVMGVRIAGQTKNSEEASPDPVGKRHLKFILIYWTIVILVIGVNYIHLNNLYHQDIRVRQQIEEEYCKNPVEGYECF